MCDTHDVCVVSVVCVICGVFCVSVLSVLCVVFDVWALYVVAVIWRGLSVLCVLYLSCVGWMARVV